MRHRRPAECRQVDALQRADRRPRRRRRRTIRSAPSSRMSARSRCPIRGSTRWRSSPSPTQIIPTRLTFVDIAGLVRGASKGEGLGNQFLANIREVDAIAHVVRCFEDDDVTHVEGQIDPIADIETIETELMLADLDSLEKRVDALEKKAKGNDKEAKETLDLVKRALALLRDGKPARLVERKPEEETAVPLARPADLAAGALRLQRRRRLGRDRQRVLAQGRGARQGRRRGLRRHLGQDRVRDRGAAAARSATTISPTVGLKEPGLDRLIRAGYDLLHLVTYFTVGPKEARAWTITHGHQGAAGGRRHPHRFRARLHPRRDHRLRRLREVRRRGRRARRRQAAARRQGIRRRRRRRDAFPVQHLGNRDNLRVGIPGAHHVADALADQRARHRRHIGQRALRADRPRPRRRCARSAGGRRRARSSPSRRTPPPMAHPAAFTTWAVARRARPVAQIARDRAQRRRGRSACSAAA